MYMPTILDARHVSSYLLGPYIAMLFTDCQSGGRVQYAHILFVYTYDPQRPSTQPQRLLAVAAEVNNTRRPGSPSHFLGLFPGNGHVNLGASSDWANLDIFARTALEVAAEQLNVSEPPQPLPHHR